MENTKLLHMDSVGALFNGTRIKNLSIDIFAGGITQVRTPFPDAVYALMYGEVIPHSGFISVAGVNVTERNRNERRVAVMPLVITEKNVYRLLSSVLTIDKSLPTVYEMRRDELKKKIIMLKSQLKEKPDNADEIKKQIKQAELDLTALGLKMRRRQTELELNLKSAKALLASLKKTSTSPEHIEKLSAKVFSAQYELCAYTHKQLPDSITAERVNYVTEKLNLSESSDYTALSYACAYACAPMLIICMDNGSIDINALSASVEKAGITVCLISPENAEKKVEEVVDVKALHFIKETDN